MDKRDERIHFIPDGHRYVVDGSSEGYVSVTSLIKTMFPPFDPDRVIRKMMVSKSATSSKYDGLTPSEIKRRWASIGENASRLGTSMHEQIENFSLWGNIPDAVTPEFRYFQNFLRDHQDLEPHRIEWRIFHEEALLCGSVDMVYRRGNDFVVVDWKRSKYVRRNNPFANGTHNATKNLEDCNFNHYSLQLGIYKYILREKYGVNVVDAYMVVLHPLQENYEIIRPRDVSENVNQLVEERVKKYRPQCLSKS
ncbi:putative ATP-dependent nuclease [Feldmannia species virus]|uniref:Putative ATP-dependent nuclease n=1 Tax=Feldmannia species virus TaxID=39420 RepID=B5LWK9_9PHYC|nr:putative ATP-dependent nuclease [Feldmannia species virus]ACH46872.1 putative ATP-dependent nuclease [Feldmannia species virus]